ncbi:MAG: YraN family protein [Elusimicrobia bacterium]|jgi:putative endonuclease|nr:YraN family protein [Elusimicrobiota bacterium]
MSRAAGERAERQAEEFLRQRGMTILARNFRTRSGEIDLVAQDGETVVFVEVRSRSSEAFGSPEETVTAVKRRRIIRTALAYAQSRGLDVPLRFDVVALSPRGILHIPGAFDAAGRP